MFNLLLCSLRYLEDDYIVIAHYSCIFIAVPYVKAKGIV